MKTALLALHLFVTTGVVLAQEGMSLAVQVGDALPALSGVDLQGKPASLSRYPDGVTAVLSFWSLGCVDCIRELDDLRAIRREFPPGQVAVVAVNTDSSLPPARVEEFVRRYEAARGTPLDVVHLLDRDDAILKKLGVTVIPLVLVADHAGRLRSVISGYSPDDRERVARAVGEGRAALGGWGTDVRARLRTLLRSTGAEGPVEWGSFRVEEEMSLFGLYDARGWLADATGRRDRDAEARRVEAVVAERVKVGILRAALSSVGIRLPAPAVSPFAPRGIEVPESPLAGESRWKRLYTALNFDQFYREESRSALWVGDAYHVGILADVDLGGLRARLHAVGIPGKPTRLRIEAVSDYDFKARAVIEDFRRTSYRLQAIEGLDILYLGDAAGAVEEIKAVSVAGLRVFAEETSPSVVRLEIL